MERLKLFVLTCVLTGVLAALGSMVGNATGEAGLMIGGVAGGLLGTGAAALIARGRRWIAPEAFNATSVGAGIGFCIAAYLAVTNLSSPVIPILSTSLSGLGALIGRQLGRPKRWGQIRLSDVPLVLGEITNARGSPRAEVCVGFGDVCKTGRFCD